MRRNRVYFWALLSGLLVVLLLSFLRDIDGLGDRSGSLMYLLDNLRYMHLQYRLVKLH